MQKLNFQGIVLSSLGVLIIILVLRSLLKKSLVGRHKEPNIDESLLDPSTDYTAIATELFNAFSGIDWTSTKARAIEKALGLNDEEFKKVYSLYNSIYTNPPDTLRTDFESEWIWGSGTDAFRDRLDILQLP